MIQARQEANFSFISLYPTFGEMSATLVIKNNLTGIEMIPIQAQGEIGRLVLRRIEVYRGILDSGRGV